MSEFFSVKIKKQETNPKKHPVAFGLLQFFFFATVSSARSA